MTLLQILYITSGFIALGAGALQLIKLVRRKNSDEYNLGTWLMWTCTQSVSATYAFSLGDPLIMFISSSWATFYLMMSILIIHYSSSRDTLFKSVPHTGHKTNGAIPVEVAPDNASPLDLAAESTK